MSLSESLLTDAEMEAVLDSSGLLSDAELEASLPRPQDIMDAIGGLPDDSWTSSLNGAPAKSPLPPQPPPPPPPSQPQTLAAMGPCLSIIPETSILEEEQMPWGQDELETSMAAQAVHREVFGVGGTELMAELEADEALAKSASSSSTSTASAPPARNLAAVAAAEGWTPPASANSSGMQPSALFAGRTEPLGGDSLLSQTSPMLGQPETPRPTFGLIPPTPELKPSPKQQQKQPRPSQIPSLIDEIPSSRISAASYQTHLGPPAALAPRARTPPPTSLGSGLATGASEALMSTPMVGGLKRPSLPLSTVHGSQKHPQHRLSQDGSYLMGEANKSSEPIGEVRAEAAETMTAPLQKASEAAPPESALSATSLIQSEPASVSPAGSLHSIPEMVNKSAPEPASAPIKIRSNTMGLNFASPQIGTRTGIEWMLRNEDKKRTAQIQFVLRCCSIAAFSLEVAGEEAPIALSGGKIQIGPGHIATCRLFFFPKLAEEVDGKLYLSVRDLDAPESAQQSCIKIQARPKRAPVKPQAKPLQDSNAKANIPPATTEDVTKPQTPNAAPATSPIRVKEAMGSAGLRLWQDMVCVGVVPVGSSKKVHVPLGNLSDSPLPVELSLEKPRSDLSLGSAELGPKNANAIPITFTPTTPGPIHMNLLINVPNESSSEKSIGVVKLSGFAVAS